MTFGTLAGDGAKLAEALIPDPTPDDFPGWLYDHWDRLLNTVTQH